MAKEDDKSLQKPKRPKSAYMLWLSSVWEKIEAETQGWPCTAVYKKAGQMWMSLEDKSEWEEKAAEEKEQYDNDLKLYYAKQGGSQEASEMLT